MADNSVQSGGDTIRDKDRGAAKTQVMGLDVNIGGTESLGTGTTVGTKNALDVNLAGSAGGVAPVPGAITAAGANTPGTASTTSTTGQVVAAVASAGNATFHLVATAFVGTVVFEASLDGGLNYAPVMSIREDGTGGAQSEALAITAAFIRAYTVGLPGFTHFRVRAAVFTSGSLAVYINQGPFLVETNPTVSLLGNGDTAVVRASAALTATTTSATQTTPAGAKGVVLTSNVTAVSGTTPSVTTTVQYLDPASGNWVALSAASAAQTAAGTSTITVYPGVTTAAPGTGSLAVNAPLPRSWRLLWTVTGTIPSLTFSVGASYIG